MSESLACPVAADGERVHRYVAGTLEPEAVAEFEIHMLGCAKCQAAVREGATVSSALRRLTSAQAPAASGARRGFWWTVPLGVAAAGALWLVVRGDAPLERLGRVSTAPAFAGVPVRGDVDSVSQLADSAMTAYAAGRYREAARLLGTVTAADRTPALSFYFGLATLMSGDPAGAVNVLHEVPDGSPYAAEAHFFSAKAWLQWGHGDSALVQLGAVPAEARIAAHAAALADSVRGVLR